MGLLNLILRCIYPSLCRSCGVLIPVQTIFCGLCASGIKPIVSLVLPLDKHTTFSVFAVSEYASPVRSLVVKKFSGDLLASHHLAQLMLVHTPISQLEFDYIVPVPLHWTRYASRGFNQAQEMAKVIGREKKIPVLQLVRRTRKTAFQWSLPALRRRENVLNAFDLSLRYKLMGTDFLQDKRVLLVDDLCTTGATLKQVAAIVQRCKPASVTAVVGCRTV